MSKFKVGDKVRVYDKGMIYTFIVKKCDSDFIYYDEKKFSIKQCRKLVKKKEECIWIDPIAMMYCNGQLLKHHISSVEIKGWVKYKKVN